VDWMWASFAPTAMFTTPVAGHLVKFAGIDAGRGCARRGQREPVSWPSRRRRAGARVSGSRSNARAARAGSRELSHCSARGMYDGGRRRASCLSRRVVRRSVEPVRNMFAASPELRLRRMHRVPGEGRIALPLGAEGTSLAANVCFRGRNSRHSTWGVPPPHWGTLYHHPSVWGMLRRTLLERRHDAFPLSASRTTACSWSRQWARCRRLVESLARERAEGSVPFGLSSMRWSPPTIFFDNLVHQTLLTARASTLSRRRRRPPPFRRGDHRRGSRPARASLRVDGRYPDNHLRVARACRADRPRRPDTVEAFDVRQSTNVMRGCPLP